MKMSTKYISVYLSNFDVNISIDSVISQQDLFGYIKIMIHNTPIDESLPKSACYIDERFNEFHIMEKSCKIQNYLNSKYLELKSSDFRYGQSDTDGIIATKNIRTIDFFKYIESDMRDFKIKNILNEE